MIYHFILNPKSGRTRKFKNIVKVIKKTCQARSLSYHIYFTTAPGDATEYVGAMVRNSHERQRFICVGGDGTLNEIVNSAPCNDNVEFGVIPNGTGNDFIKNFTNRKLFLDLDAQIDGEAVTLDLIKCNDFYCVNMLNIGFDCSVAKDANDLKKKHKFILHNSAYTLAIIKNAFKPFGTRMKIIFDDGEVIDDVFTLTAIGNGRYCGGGYCATPIATMQDGLMDICAVDKVSLITFAKLIKSYKSGTHLQNRAAQKIIHYKQTSHIKMEFDAPIAVCIDGEIKGAINVDITLCPGGFNFVLPKGVAIKK